MAIGLNLGPQQMIQADTLVFNYSKDVGFSYPEIDVDSGESLLVLGTSGSGKTTLLHLLAGLVKPKSGAVRVGKDRADLANQGDRFRGKNIGIVFQQPYFVKSLSVEQNLKIAQTMAGVQADSVRINELLDKLGLKGRGKDSIGDLSTGELQRVSIARALVNRPSVVLADEPTASLDDNNCERVIGLLEAACQDEGASLIVVTHDKRLSGHFTQSISL